jgi:hypothetical protein
MAGFGAGVSKDHRSAIEMPNVQVGSRRHEDWRGETGAFRVLRYRDWRAKDQERGRGTEEPLS